MYCDVVLQVVQTLWFRRWLMNRHIERYHLYFISDLEKSVKLASRLFVFVREA